MNADHFGFFPLNNIFLSQMHCGMMNGGRVGVCVSVYVSLSTLSDNYCMKSAIHVKCDLIRLVSN